MTRFHWVVAVTVLAALWAGCASSGSARLLLLGAIFSGAGLYTGLGVSFPQLQMFGHSLCQVSTRRPWVALTFDDGPDPATTPALLELLARRGVRAAFFCIGKRVNCHRELTGRIAAEGHLVENHTQHHRHWTNLMSVQRLYEDIAQAQQEIQEVTGRKPVFFRAPAGLTNDRIFRVAKDLQLRVTGYTRRGLDKRPGAPEQIVERLLRRLHPGAILLLHDGGVDKERLLAVTTLLIDKLQAQGYQCVRLDELADSEGQL